MGGLAIPAAAASTHREPLRGALRCSVARGMRRSVFCCTLLLWCAFVGAVPVTHASDRPAWPAFCPAAEKAVLQLSSALRRKATELSSSSGRQWSAKEVEMCLFARAVGQGGEAVTKGKAAGKVKGKAGGGSGEAGTAAGADGGSSKRRKR